MTNKEHYQLKTLYRGLEVLELIKSAGTGVTLSDLSRRLEEPTTVVFRILKTLEAAGQISQEAQGKGYRPVMSPQDNATAIRLSVSLLRMLSDSYPEALTEKELASTLRLADLEVARSLRVLGEEKLVEEPASGRWRLAYGCLELVAPLIGQDDLVDNLRPVMEEIRKETRETVVLFRISGERQTVIVSLPSPQPIRYVLNVGSSFPLYLGAAGKVALAYMAQEDSRRYLQQCDLDAGTNRAPDRDGILRQLTHIRHDGYSISIGERVEGAAGVAVPICGTKGQLIAVMSIVLPAFRTDRAKLESLAMTLRRMLASAGYRSDAGS